MKNDFGVGEVLEAKGWACHDANGSCRVRVGMTIGTPDRNLATVLGGFPVVWHDFDLLFVGFVVDHLLSFWFGAPPSFEVSSIYGLSVSFLMPPS